MSVPYTNNEEDDDDWTTGDKGSLIFYCMCVSEREEYRA